MWAAVDIMRLGKISAAGYTATFRAIPPTTTPQNRVLIGRPPEIPPSETLIAVREAGSGSGGSGGGMGVAV